MEVLSAHFPNLTATQIEQFRKLGDLYKDWNTKINVISRKDIDNLYPHHILHALIFPKIFPFKDGTRILDLGTGGGIPGIPLAIFYPEVQFTLIDGRRKKITVVKDICEQLGLKNVEARHIRAEEVKEKFDFVTARAVASLDKLWLWSQRLLSETHKNSLPNGLLALKGGNVDDELESLGKDAYYEVFPILDSFPLEYYDEKYLIYVQA